MMQRYSRHTLEQTCTQRLQPIYECPQAARNAAQTLVCHVANIQKTQLAISGHLTLNDTQINELKNHIHNITYHDKPLEYCIGWVPFCDATITVAPPVLIPRHDTEHWCAAALAHHSKQSPHPRAILDMCTGTGCVAISFAHAFPNARVDAFDIDAACCRLAQRNAERNVTPNVTITHHDCTHPWKTTNTYDVITANPPYVTQTEYEQLEPSVRCWESSHALVAEDNGTALYPAIAQSAYACLIPGGTLWIEIGPHQAESITRILTSAGFTSIALHTDLAGRPRCLYAHKPF